MLNVPFVPVSRLVTHENAGEMTRTSANFVMSNTTPVSPLALLLLCGNLKAEEVRAWKRASDKVVCVRC